LENGKHTKVYTFTALANKRGLFTRKLRQFSNSKNITNHSIWYSAGFVGFECLPVLGYEQTGINFPNRNALEGKLWNFNNA